MNVTVYAQASRTFLQPEEPHFIAKIMSLKAAEKDCGL